MPDPTLQTVSASQMAALFGASPYMTRFTLWHQFRGDLPPVKDEESERMEWGTRLEGAILDAVADRLNLIVRRAGERVYVSRDSDTSTKPRYQRHPTAPIGCTLDGEIWDPSRGEGIVEAKNVDWMEWKKHWTETDIPSWVMIQIQTQLAVTRAKWAVCGCLVGGNQLRTYDVAPAPDWHAEIELRAEDFMRSLARGEEPPPTGLPLETEWIKARYPVDDDVPPVDMRDDRHVSEIVREYRYWRDTETGARKQKVNAEAKLAAIMGSAPALRTWGHVVRVTESHVAEMDVGLPPEIAEALWPSPSREIIDAARAWRHTVRRAHTRRLYRVDTIDAETSATPPWGDPITGQEEIE